MSCRRAPIRRGWEGFWIAAACVALFGPAPGRAAPPDEASLPNIVLVLADDLGPLDLSIYDPDTVSPTPNIDRLAEQGIRFTDANTPSSVCTPTRYAVMTGRYAWRTRLARGVLSIFAEPLIDPQRLTLPEMLREHGYRTAAIGKWHLGMNVLLKDGKGYARVVDRKTPLGVDYAAEIQGGPLDYGFDTYFGAQLPRVHAFVRDRHFVGEPTETLTDRPFEVEGWDEAQRGPRQLEAALEFIDEGRAGKSPFFLYFASQQPHPPFVPADSLAGVPVAGTSPAGLRAECIKELDLTVGELTRRIDELGLSRSTLIIVTSDNGAPEPGSLFGDKARSAPSGGLRGSKGSVLEAGHRVPFVARWGDGTEEGSTIAPGSVSPETISLQDLMATLADRLGVPLGNDVAEDSESFLGVLQGKVLERPVHDELVFQGSSGQFALREGNWKLVVDLDSVAVGSDPTAPLPSTGQLFDLRSDPGERVDRSGSYPRRVREMAHRLNDLRRRGYSTKRNEEAPERGHPDRPERSEEDGTATGRWRRVDAPGSAGDLTPEQQAQLEQLESIGYVGGVVRESRSGVTRYDADRTLAGVNFYSSGHAEEAVLMDMEGEVLHRWTASCDDFWPHLRGRYPVNTSWWRRVRLLGNGDILAIYEGIGIIRLDKDSRLVWAKRNNAHHDMEVLPNGNIVTLTRAPRQIPELDDRLLTLDDSVTILDADGNEKRSVSVWDCFRNSPFLWALKGGRKESGDIFHTNTIHVLKGTLEDRLPGFRRGDILTSLDAMGVLAVLSLDGKTVRWVRKSPPHGQHDPQILPNGHLLVFDNRNRSEESVVMELDPVTGENVWEFRGTEERPFQSRTCGAATRLSNGNTLITESDGGRALEVTPDGTVVWEFYNPARAGDQGQYIATLSEVERVAWADVDAWLD